MDWALDSLLILQAGIPQLCLCLADFPVVDIHFSSARAHFSEGCSTVAGHLWAQGVLPAAPRLHIPPAQFPDAGERSRDKATGYQGESAF